MKASDLKSTDASRARDVIWVTPDTRLEDALARMAEHGIHHLPVVANGEVVGMLVERDVLAAFITVKSAGPLRAWRLSRTETSSPAGDSSSETLSLLRETDEPSDYLIAERYMKRDVHCIDEATDVREALTRMIESHATALPVLREGKLAGIVTESDMLRLLRELLEPRDSTGDVIHRGEALLANPLLQNVLKTLSDIGI